MITITSRALLLVLFSATAGAQGVPQVKLKPPQLLETEFVGITSVRELADERALMTDGRAQRLYIVNFSTQASVEVGRKGSGPGEYRMVGFVRPLAADSSVMDDLIGRRWLLFNGSAIVRTVPPDDPLIVATQGTLTGADALGHFLGRAAITPKRNAEVSLTYTAADSDMVVLWTRATAKPDTIARLRRPIGGYNNYTFDSTGRITRSSSGRPPLSPDERAALARDGWLVVARLEPYRVDWRRPDGAWIKGPALGKPIPFNAREQKDYADRNTGGVPPAGLPPEARARIEADRARMASMLPEFIPPFMTAPIPTQNGEALVLRTRSADFPDPRYDIITRRGTIRGTLQLAQGERVIGFGPRTVYIAGKDADDIERLRRHPWP